MLMPNNNLNFKSKVPESNQKLVSTKFFESKLKIDIIN